jgi:homopolymeric O-antigen transport system permease protein
MLGFNRNDVRLIINLFKINTQDKYLGSLLGTVWAFVNPMIMLGIFTFVFGFVYKAKLPGATTSLTYVVWLISGYGPWLAISEALNNSANSIIANKGMVKNVSFKLEVLPIASILTSIVPLLVSLFFLAIILIFDANVPTWHALFIIPAILIMYFFVISLGFYLSSVAVFIRDVTFILPNIILMCLFMSPIFYSIESMPHILQVISKVNPFYIITQGFRQPLVYHQIPNTLLLGQLYVLVLSSLLCYFGLKLFSRLKGHFNTLL